MIKYLTVAIVLFAMSISTAQNSRTDTTTQLSVYNTAARFKLIPADFGAVITQPLIGTMVRSYDTIMVLKATGRTDTVSRRPVVRYKVERVCDRMSTGLRDMIVVMELNKDCDVTQTCLNVQRAGAKAFVIIHNSNSEGNIKLPKRGLYKDSIRIPIYTVRSNVGDSITTLLPSIVGIRKQVPIRPMALTSQNKDSIFAASQKVRDDIFIQDNQPLNNETIGKQGLADASAQSLTQKNIGWSIAPNPVTVEAVINYNFATKSTINIDVFNELGQIVTNYELPNTQTGKVNLDVSAWQNGAYYIRLKSETLKEVKRLMVVH